MQISTIRRFVAGFVLISFLGVLLWSGSEETRALTSEFLTFFQFVPSMVGFIGTTSLIFTGFILILIITLIFGRLYCSVICPLGILQDIVFKISRFNRRVKKSYQNPYTALRISILILVSVGLSIGSLSFLNILDPYSLFTRIFTNLFRLVQIKGVNGLNKALDGESIILLSDIPEFSVNGIVLVSTLILFVIVLILSLKGRDYCNTVCPVGTLLGFVSAMSFYQFKLDPEACNGCKKCEKACKSDCIDSKEKRVDGSRCVACFNCLDSCSKNAISYTSKHNNSVSNSGTSRRKLVHSSLLIGLAGSVALPVESKTQFLIKDKQKDLFLPPGAIDRSHFSKQCIGCHLCVNICPSGVLGSLGFANDYQGTNQPEMNYSFGYCQHDCHLCGQVCPTEAIKLYPIKEKQQIKTGEVKFTKDDCIIFSREEKCGVCLDVCPTGAIKTIEDRGLSHPEIIPDLCNGCGKCQFVCPELANALRIRPWQKHGVIDLSKKVEEKIDQDALDFLDSLE